jgi:prevent-host-death family protein
LDDGLINTHDAKTHLSQLPARVEAGETIIIARDGKPVAKLVPITSAGKRQFGALREKVRIGPEFFEPLPEDELKAWE